MLTSESYKHAMQKKKENEKNIRDFIEEKSVRGDYLRLIPKNQQSLFYKIFTGGKSYSKAVKAKCLDCTCFNKEEIKKCEVFTCPLHNLRPYKND